MSLFVPFQVERQCPAKLPPVSAARFCYSWKRESACFVHLPENTHQLCHPMAAPIDERDMPEQLQQLTIFTTMLDLLDQVEVQQQLEEQLEDGRARQKRKTETGPRARLPCEDT